MKQFNLTQHDATLKQNTIMDPNLSAMLVCECVCVSPIMSFMLLHLENPVFNLCSWFPLCEKPVGPSQQRDQDRALFHGNVVEQKKNAC